MELRLPAALDAVLAAYDERREMIGIAFRAANLSDEHFDLSLAGASPESVAALLELLRRDIDAFGGLVEMLADVRDRVQAALPTTRGERDHGQ
jgi:hypothetical protein